MKVFAVCGSLRKGSFNRKLLNNAIALAPAGMTFDVYEGLRDLPPFDQDFENDLPSAARDLKARVESADGVLFVTPEYNHSIPGILKNAIDWLSRPNSNNSLGGKPVLILGCGGSTFGAVRMHIAFREILFSLAANVLPKFEVIVFRAQERFDKDGTLTDKVTIEAVTEGLRLFGQHIEAARYVRELRAGVRA
jgi:chromate reductase, NAD(P)H dehydrogenase (quinone)